jgi:hypothetical protein
MTRWEPIERFGGWFLGGTVEMVGANQRGDALTKTSQRASG